MDTSLVILALVPSVLSIVVLLVTVILGIKREKRREEDVLWETTKEIILHSSDICYTDDQGIEEIVKWFNLLYEGLKTVKSRDADKFLQERKARRQEQREPQRPLD